MAKKYFGKTTLGKVLSIISGGLKTKEDRMHEYDNSKVEELWYDMKIADYNELDNWEYEIEGDAVILKKYIGSDENVTIYDKYPSNDENLKTKLVDTTGMFKNNDTIKTVEISNFVDSTELTSMESMFSNCTALESINLGTIDVNNVENIDSMIFGCENLDTEVIEEMFTKDQLQDMNINDTIYIVRFMNGDEIFDEQKVKHGKSVILPSTDPTKEEDENGTYLFKE